ncbi:alpha/beta hydrolase [Amycolatopsis sp. cg5]|uniref:alpha/beta hydrolase n=1 Tax=Amycolatopsis sp. cg5 TaxID=3238802 RepID=UPI003525DEBE
MIRALALTLLAPVAPAAAPALDWQPCPTPLFSQLVCGNVPVPLDWAKPDGAKISIRVSKLPASGDRIGSLLTNPGGPGGEGAGAIGRGELGTTTPEFAELRKRFDFIGFDPRGVGESTPKIQCDPAKLYDPSIGMFPRDNAAYQRLIELNRAAGKDCLARTGPAAEHVDTVSVADDIDAIRRALGESKISWLGVSYGSEVGATYAARYPSRVRAAVLDGAVDHSRPMRLTILDSAIAGEDSLHRFAAWCQTTDECALRGQDVIARYDQLMRDPRAERLANGFYGGLILTQAWPVLSKLLANATGAQPDLEPLLGNSSLGTEYGASFRVIGCHDFPSPFTGAADMRVSASMVRTLAPHTWHYSEMWELAAGCAGWPIKAQFPPQPERVKDVPPILVVGGEHDPSTPLVWARGLVSRISGGHLLTYAADGHTGLYNSACVRTEEAKYLVSGVVPDHSTRC